MAQEKKKFFEVETPLTGGKITLAAFSIEQLAGRLVKYDLTRMMKGKSLEAVFKVKVDDSKATAEPIKILLLPYFIRRMMRKSVSYVEDSFSQECADSVLRVKFFLITRKKVTRAVRKALREGAKNYIQEYMKSKGKEEIFSEILDNHLQKSMSLKLKKIYPLALCEIREIKIESLKEGIVVKKPEKAKEEESQTV